MFVQFAELLLLFSINPGNPSNKSFFFFFFLSLARTICGQHGSCLQHRNTTWFGRPAREVGKVKHSVFFVGLSLTFWKLICVFFIRFFRHRRVQASRQKRKVKGRMKY